MQQCIGVLQIGPGRMTGQTLSQQVYRERGQPEALQHAEHGVAEPAEIVMTKHHSKRFGSRICAAADHHNTKAPHVNVLSCWIHIPPLLQGTTVVINQQ